MLRRLRVLAVFFMVPLVLLAPSRAAAVGTWTTVSLQSPSAPLLGDNIPGTIDTIDCSFSIIRTGDYSLDLGSNGSCYGLPDVTWGYAQMGESGASYTISLTGQTDAGSTCSGSNTSTLAQHSANGTLRVAGTISPSTLSVSAPDCTVTEVCIIHQGRSFSEACQTVNIAPLSEDPDAGDSCAHGFPGSIRYSWENLGPNPYNANARDWGLRVTVALNVQGVSTARWYVTQYNNGTGVTNFDPREITTEATWIEWVTNKFPYQGDVNVAPPMPPRDDLPWGYEVFATPEEWNEPTDGTPFGQYSKNRAESVPTGPDQFFGGITQPEHCRWWIGKKLADISDTDLDEPFVDLDNDAPVGGEDPEPPVEPVIEQPPAIDEPDDDLGWLGALAALLRTIWNTLVAGFQSVVGAIKGIASAIVDGISDMLNAAFVPSDGFLEAKWSGVESKWQGTSPGKYVNTVADMQTGSVSGCGGLPLNVDLGGGVRIDEHIGAACSGSMATAAGITRAVFTAVFAVAGAIACVRAVGAGLGWDPSIGKGNAA